MVTGKNDSVPQREPIEEVEIVYLSIIVAVATVLNLLVFVQLVRSSRTPTARTSFLTGPYHLSSFTLFKLNLCITDFMILLIHALGKIVWLITYEWRFGSYGCKMYMFLSALAFYTNSNVIVAIGLDRLKVVYTSNVQGATSVRRVRLMIALSWIVAIVCSFPQIFFWDVYNVNNHFVQCVSLFDDGVADIKSRGIFQLASKVLLQLEISSDEDLLRIWHRMGTIYVISHQLAVFWIPFCIIFASYVFIVLRLLHFRLTPVKTVRPSRATGSHSQSAASRSEHSGMSHAGSARVPASCEKLLAIENIALDTLPRSPSDQLRIWIRQGIRVVRKTPSTSDRVPVPINQRTNRDGFFCRSIRRLTAADRSQSVPVWRRQIGSRVFLTALAIVVAHITMWLPYNLIASLRLAAPATYESALLKGGNFMEDLIVVNSLLNPLLYAYKCR